MANLLESEPLFRGPQNTQINTMELRRIKVDIHRNIPVKGPVTELQRDILNPEDLIVKRREGEGCKPIFDREEIKKVIKTNEVEERRTVVAIDEEQSTSTIKSHTSSRRSLSLSPIRNYIYSSGYPSSCQSRHRIDLKHQDIKMETCDIRKNNGRSILEKRREYKEKYTEKDANKHDINRSRSKELHNSYSRPFMEEKSYCDRYRERSDERSHERRDRDRDRDRNSDRDRNRGRERERDRDRDRNSDRDRNRGRERERDRDRDRNSDRDRNRGRERERERERERDRDRDRDRNKDRSRERRDIAPRYIESPIPVPTYYGSFPPRLIAVNPMVNPLRGQIPPIGRGRHPALMAPVRPFPPRFPSDMYRSGHHPQIQDLDHFKTHLHTLSNHLWKYG